MKRIIGIVSLVLMLCLVGCSANPLENSKDIPERFHFQEEQNENKPLDTTILSENEFEEMQLNFERSLFRGTGPLLEHLREPMSTYTYPVRKCENRDVGSNNTVNVHYMIFQKNDSNDKIFVFGTWEERQHPWDSIYSLIVFENNKFNNDYFAYGEHDYQKLINPIDL